MLSPAPIDGVPLLSWCALRRLGMRQMPTALDVYLHPIPFQNAVPLTSFFPTTLFCSLMMDELCLLTSTTVSHLALRPSFLIFWTLYASPVPDPYNHNFTFLLTPSPPIVSIIAGCRSYVRRESFTLSESAIDLVELHSNCTKSKSLAIN